MGTSISAALGMAIGIILIDLTPGYNVDLMSYLFGNIAFVSWGQVGWMAALDLVILVVATLELPFSIFIMKGFFDAVPWDIEMSAMTDGASLLMAGIYALKHQDLWTDERESNLLDGGAHVLAVRRDADELEQPREIQCARVAGEFLGLVDFKGSGLVVKLPRARVQELIDEGVGQPFAPAGKVFKEWVSVPERDRRRWRALLREGIAFVAPR